MTVQIVDLRGSLPPGQCPCELRDEFGRIVCNRWLLMVSLRSPVGTMFSQINWSAFRDYSEKLFVPQLRLKMHRW